MASTNWLILIKNKNPIKQRYFGPLQCIRLCFSGARGFSKDTLKQISTRLALSEPERQLLESLCEKQFGKSKKSKEEAEVKLKQALLYQVKIADEKVSLISDWYHMAILALMDSNSFKSVPFVKSIPLNANNFKA